MSNLLVAINLLIMGYFGVDTIESTPVEIPVVEAKVNDEKSEDPLEYRLMTATGYSSSPDETDDTPFVTASATKVRWGIIATNDFPFGTKLRIPDLFGSEIFVVEDRMHKRFTDRNRLDVWFPSKKEAVHFGVNNDVVVEVISLPESEGVLAQSG